MNRLAGKVALISGGARGQGATEAKLFVAEGASVVFGDVLDDDGKKLEAEIRAAGGQATYVHLDVTREADWRAAVATTRQAYGKLNVLVNNAGILFRAKIEETSEAEWDRIMAVNVKGVFLGTKCALPAMRAGGRRLHHQHLVHGRARRQPGRDCAPTPPPRARCGSSRNRPRSSTPGTRSGATPCIPARSPPT